MLIAISVIIYAAHIYPLTETCYAYSTLAIENSLAFQLH